MWRLYRFCREALGLLCGLLALDFLTLLRTCLGDRPSKLIRTAVGDTLLPDFTSRLALFESILTPIERLIGQIDRFIPALLVDDPGVQLRCRSSRASNVPPHRANHIIQDHFETKALIPGLTESGRCLPVLSVRKARSRAVVVLDRPPPRLCLDHLDAFEVLEDFDVVADLAQALFQLLGEFIGARHPLVEDGQDLHAQWVGERLDQALVDPVLLSLSSWSWSLRPKRLLRFVCAASNHSIVLDTKPTWQTETRFLNLDLMITGTFSSN